MCWAHGGGGDPKGWGPDNTFFWCHKTIYIFNVSRQIWLSQWHFYRPYIEEFQFCSVLGQNFTHFPWKLVSTGKLANRKEDSDKLVQREVCHFSEENPQRGSFGLSFFFLLRDFPIGSSLWKSGVHYQCRKEKPLTERKQTSSLKSFLFSANHEDNLKVRIIYWILSIKWINDQDGAQ